MCVLSGLSAYTLFFLLIVKTKSNLSCLLFEFVMDLTETHDKKNNNTFSIRKLILSIILPILAYKILDQVSKTKQRKYKHYFDSLLGYEEHTKKADYSTVEQLTENFDSRPMKLGRPSEPESNLAPHNTSTTQAQVLIFKAPFSNTTHRYK